MSRRLRLETLASRLAPCAGIPKSYVIAIDGLRGDGIINASTPNLRSLINGTWGDGPGIDYHGAYADFATTIPDAVTVSGPNHTSIYTGVTTAKHGVTGNNSVQMGAVTYPDYLKLLELNNPARGTAKLVSWDYDDMVPTGADYRRVQFEELNSQLAADMIARIPTTAYATATGNLDVDAIFQFYDNLDYAGHDSGFTPGNPHYREVLSTIDGLIGIVLNSIKNRPTFASEDWQIVVTSDHGGRIAGHGFASADNYTIPFLVCSRSVGQGWLTGTPGNVDVLPTVLTHFNVPIPANIDGIARSQVRTFPPTTINQDRVAQLHFDFTYADSSGNGVNASVGGGSPTFVAGKFDQAVSLKAATSDWLTLGNPTALQFGSATDFSYSMWYKADGALTGTPPILSNQNLSAASSAGFTLSGNQGTGNQIGESLIGGTGTRRDWNFVDINVGQWIFISGTFDRDGNGMLYVGYDGIMYKLAQNIGPIGNVNSALPWNIGQDGTHTYTFGLNAAIDELSIWRRELRDDEVRTLFADGNVPPSPPLIAYPDTYSVNEDNAFNIAAPALLANDILPPAVLYSENFDGMTLGPTVDEVGGDGTDFTHTPPAGWAVNNSGVPGNGTSNDGVTDWAGWSFADKNFWTTVSANQNRTDFTRGSGVVAIADPDEWDDLPHATGTFNTLMTTPAINLTGLKANSLTLNFDSSFRPFANMQGYVDVSYNNFATTATRIFTRTTQDLRNEAVSILVSGHPTTGSAKFRFGLINAGNDWWWAVDNIVVAGVSASATVVAALVTPPAHGTANVNPDGSFTYTPQPDFNGMDQFVYSATGNGITTNAPVTITVLPRPDVTTVTVNDGSPQRSRITSMKVAFDMLLNTAPLLQAGTFSLKRVSDGANIGAVTATSATEGGVTVATITFSGANTESGSLTDGNWTLTVQNANVVASSNALNMGANATRTGFKRLFGDADGSGKIDSTDFLLFRLAYLNDDPTFSFDGNGPVDSNDFLQFRLRFLQSV